MANNSGTKIAINAFLRETTGMRLLIAGSFRGRQSEEDISDSKVLRHVATATKSGPK